MVPLLIIAVAWLAFGFLGAVIAAVVIVAIFVTARAMAEAEDRRTRTYRRWQ